MPRICRKISDGSIVPDFQSKSVAGSLVVNAVKAGLGAAEDFEELEIDDVTFQGHVDSYKALFEEDILAEKQKVLNMKASIKTKFLGLGFTAQELKYLKHAIEE